MTTSDLIAEALIRFREEFTEEVRRIVREELRADKYAVTPRGSGAMPPLVRDGRDSGDITKR